MSFRTPRALYALLSTILHLTSLWGGSLLLCVLLAEGGYYFHGGCVVALSVLLVLTITTSFVLSVVWRRHIPLTGAVFHGHIGSLFMHAIFSLGCILFGGWQIGFGIRLFVVSDVSALTLPAGLCLILCGIFALCGHRFSVRSLGSAPLWSVLSGTALSLSCVLFSLSLYFDASSPKNASMKHLLIFTFLLLSLFFLSEVRRTLGKKENILYRIVAVAAGHMTAALSVTPLVMTLFGQRPPVGNAPAYLLLTISFLYIYVWRIAPHFPRRAVSAATSETCDTQTPAAEESSSADTDTQGDDPQ